MPSKLLPHHAKLIEASGIAPEVAAARGYRSVTTKAELRSLGFSENQCRVPALLIPIRDVHGEIVSYQIRPDAPRISKNGKTVKYESPVGARQVLDVPLSVRAKLGDPKAPLAFTEGARKVDALLAAEIAAIGVTGVYGWRGLNDLGGKTALADFESIAFNGRQIYLVFDSDSFSKPEVHTALARFGEYLKHRGAHVSYLLLPHGPDGEKWGADDYLAAGHTRDELLALAVPDLPELDRPKQDLVDRVGQYERRSSGFFYWKDTRDGEVEVRLTNFAAVVVANVIEDDGTETRRVLEIEAVLSGRTCPRFRVTPAEFQAMNWHIEHLGAKATVSAGFGAHDHAREAIQVFTPDDVSERRIYTHTGWRKIDDHYVYLHAAGAIGANGPVNGIEVCLTGALQRFVLPVPGSMEERRAAVKASIGMLEVAPKRVTVPLLAAVPRAVLGNADFSEHAHGPTGARKTAMAALAQQHFGAALDALHLPAGWESTPNAIEGLLFYGKDALITVDDLAPGGSRADVERKHATAARVFRNAANRTGRNRMRSDASLAPQKPPRALLLSTGEDIPRVQSVQARIALIEFQRGDVDLEALTRCQRDADAGLFAQALASFIQWLAPRLDEEIRSLHAAVLNTRSDPASAGLHGRTVTTNAEMFFSLGLYLRFATELGAIDATRAKGIIQDAAVALQDQAATQQRQQAASDPVTRFFELLAAAIAGGSAHVAGVDGGCPEQPERWGWRERTIGTGENERVEWQPPTVSERVGWVKGDDDLYLEPNVSYNVAQKVARDEPLGVGQKTLAKRLGQRGRLLTHEHETRGKWTARPTLEGTRREVLHVSATALSVGDDAGNAGGRPIPWANSNGQNIGPQNQPKQSANEDGALRNLGPFGPIPAGESPVVEKDARTPDSANSGDTNARCELFAFLSSDKSAQSAQSRRSSDDTGENPGPISPEPHKNGPSKLAQGAQRETMLTKVPW